MTTFLCCELCHHVPVTAVRSWHCEHMEVSVYSLGCVGWCTGISERESRARLPRRGQEGPPQLYIPLRCFTFWLSSKEVAKEFLFLLWLAWLTPQKGTLGYSPEIPQSHFGNVVLLSNHLSQCVPIQRGISSIMCWAFYVRGWKTCLCCNPLEFNNSVPAGALYM